VERKGDTYKSGIGGKDDCRRCELFASVKT
jgi:hypothetical protein